MSTKTVLVVDDDLICREAVAKSLASMGYEAALAASGQEALALVAKSSVPYAAILIDRMMPEMDGVALVAQLRNDPRVQQVPMIMLTTDADSVDQLDAMKQGVDDFLYKPVDDRLLAYTLDSLT